jgi:type VI secretion system protein ImpL
MKELKDPKVWLVPVGALLSFIGASWWATAAVIRALGQELTGWPLWIVRGGLLIIGLVIGIRLFLWLRARARSRPVVDDELETALAAARARLAASPAAPTSKLNRLPLVFFLGPPGSTKTTAIMRSGLEAELLAGETQRGEVPVPTTAVNVWYAQETVFVEAGGRLLDDDTRWARLLRHLEPSRVSAVLSRGTQAPRLAVVCFGCDELLKPGASEAVPAAARRLRARLSEAAQQLGIRLPVYVLFTKADRLPYFADYVRSLSREEAQEVLGTTLAVETSPPAGTYAEHAGRRIGDAFAALLHSLSLKRLEVLPRESQEEVRAGAYEFPREVRKLTDLATQFLVELSRPSQLGVSPFLRGFYFTGVRPVIVTDPNTAAAAASGPIAPQVSLGATSVFNPRQLAEAAARSTPAPAGSRKVPDWVFLKRLLRDVVLQDRVAMAITAGGTRVNFLRRSLLGGAAALFVLLAIGFGLSFRNNRHLERDALAAARAVEPLAAVAGITPSLEALQRLDTLRSQTERLALYQRNRRPLLFGLGLYQGNQLLPPLRRLYFDRFEQLLWRDSRSDLVSWLRALPDAPGDAAEYGSAHDALKAYLITSRHPDMSTPGFLTPALLDRWSSTHALDSTRLALARLHFDFFATELRYGNPYNEAASEALVGHARGYLGQFAAAERFYPLMLADASTSLAPVQFRSADGAVRNPYVVPAAFTREGWAAVHQSLRDVDQLFTGEDWVVGEYAIAPQERQRLVQELRARYVAEYGSHWREYLRAGVVEVGAGPADAAARLRVLAENRSPLLQMLALASHHTKVDSVAIDLAFQPLHAVMPPDQPDRLIADGNQPYMQALASLRDALNQIAAAPSAERSFLFPAAQAAVDQARSAVHTTSQTFSIAGDAQAVGAAVQRLLEMPLPRIEAMIRDLPVAGVNEKGAELCRPFRQVANRYPFQPNATVLASVDDLVQLLQPGNSALAEYENALGELIVRQGPRYAGRVGAPQQPTPEFLAFLNRAAAVSRTLFDDGGAGPRLNFSLRPQLTDEIPQVTVTLDNQVHRVERTQIRTLPLGWNGTTARGMRISARIGGADVTLLEETGPWAVFQLFRQAEWRQEGNRYLVQWRFPNRPPLSAEVSFEPTAQPLLRPGAMRLDCVARVVR